MIKILNKEETLGVLSEGRKNNLNFIRFIAAVMVIFGHSYAATLSYKMGDPICRLTKNQLDFGGLAVSIFFVYGGFLIAKSMERLYFSSINLCNICCNIYNGTIGYCIAIIQVFF